MGDVRPEWRRGWTGWRVGSEPAYLRRWLANPKSQLPYTPMPVNFPFGKSTAQDIYPGTGIEQLDGVVDLLIHYDRFAQDRVSVQRMLESASHRASAIETTEPRRTQTSVPRRRQPGKYRQVNKCRKKG